MTKIEKIRAEIERRMKIMLSVEGLVTGVADNMRYQGYKSLLSFIDTLSEEPDKSLEEEISHTYHDGSVADTSDMDHVDYENIARHFANWQKEQMLKDAVEASVNTYELTPGGSSYVEFVADVSAARFKLNDKVRIVILKEEE